MVARVRTGTNQALTDDGVRAGTTSVPVAWCRDHGISIAARGAAAIIPPRKNAKPWKPDTPGAIARNLASCGDAVRFDEGVADWQRSMLADAQTSGGLLVACDAASASAVLETFRAGGFGDAAVIGRMHAGPAQVRIAG